MTAPRTLRAGGKSLWNGVVADHPDLDASQLSSLELACRQRDRADALASKAASGDPGALRHERDCALASARLIAAMRLPDAKTGRKPIPRQLRGVQGSKVTSFDRKAG